MRAVLFFTWEAGGGNSRYFSVDHLSLHFSSQSLTSALASTWLRLGTTRFRGTSFTCAVSRQVLYLDIWFGRFIADIAAT